MRRTSGMGRSVTLRKPLRAAYLRFHSAAPPTDVEVARLVATIRTRVLRLLRRRGVFAEAEDDDAPDPLAETSLALAGITSAAVQGRSALGSCALSRAYSRAVTESFLRRLATSSAAPSSVGAVPNTA